MRILLVVYDNESYIHWFPQGLAYIAAVLKRNGHNVEIYNQDWHHYPDDHLTHYLDHNLYELIGIGVTGGYYQYSKLLSLSDAINRAKNRPFFVIGGYGPSPEPEYFLRRTKANAVVMGEGEGTIVELVGALETGSALANVKGIAFTENDKVTVNETRSLIEDVDSVPWPAYDMFPMEYYRLLRTPRCTNSDLVIPLLSGRGCPYHCTFCYRMDEGFRPRSNESIIEEIRYLKKRYGITYIAFSDELLMSSKRRTISLCEAMIHAEINVRWDCNGRLNFAAPEVLGLMKRAGCVFINYGIEALDNAVLKAYRKQLNTDMIIRGVEATLAAGISPGLNVIFGNFGDTRETLNKGVEFLLKYDDGAQMRTIRPVTPYPGSELYHLAIEKGLLKDCGDFYEHKHLNSDLMSVNFTDLSEDEYYQALFDANQRLLAHYFERQLSSYREQTRRLYVEKDAGFRGYRQD